MVIRIGFLLFITACSKYSSQSAMVPAYSNPIREGSPWLYRDLGLDLNISDISCTKLCEVNNEKTFLCNLIEIGSVDLLKQYLECIKSSPAECPPAKVMSLIAGYPRKVNKMKMPLLGRAVLLGHLEITKLLFETLERYGLEACRYVFILPFDAPESISIPEFGNPRSRESCHLGSVGIDEFSHPTFTIIHQAIVSSNFELLEYLIEKYIEIETQKAKDPSSLSAWSNLEALIVKKNKKSDFALLDLALQKCACNDPNSLKILQHLLHVLQDADIFSHMESQYRSVLHAAVQCGDIKGLNNMIHAIKEAVKTIHHCQDNEIINKILNLSDGHERTLLHCAVLWRKFDIVQYLMALGASATCFNKDKISPILIAIRRYDLDMVKWLLHLECAGKASLQSNINHPGNAKLTPLNFSVSCSTGKLPCTTLRDLNWVLAHEPSFIEETKGIMSEISQALLGVGADPYIRDILDEAPLCKAAEAGDTDSVALLLNARVDPCIPDRSGRTPLHKAAEAGDADSVAELLRRGANPLAEDVKGYTPLDVASNQIQVRPSPEYDGNNRIKLSALMVQAVATLRDPDGIVVKPLTEIWMGIRSHCKYGDHKGQRGKLNQLLHCFVLDQCGVPVKILSQCKGKKRPCDDFGVSYTSLNKKRKRGNVAKCSGGSTGSFDSGGRPQAT